MYPHYLNRLAAFVCVAIISCISSPDSKSQNVGKSNDIRSLSFDEFSKRTREGYKTFKDSVIKDYEAFRDSINKEYAAFMRNPWTSTAVEKALDVPDNKEPEPDIEPEEEHDRPITNSKHIRIESVVPISWPTPYPKPIGKIREMPVVDNTKIKLKFYGTNISLRHIDLSNYRLKGNDEQSFAGGWETLSKSTTNNLITDCLSIRDTLNLPDWGYIKLLDMISSKLMGENTNEQRLLHGFLLNQSGYKVRFSYDGKHQLHVLFASNGILYNQSRFFLDNDRYYSYTRPDGREVYICNFKTPGEKEVSFGIHKSPHFSYRPYETREIIVNRHPDLTLKVTPNKNLIDFFNDYPAATPDSSPLSMWAIHGNTPVSEEIKNDLYPVLRKAIEGKSQYAALQLLLKVAQSFPYGYDDQIWGHDRAFWMDESWAYPLSDCEDHAINFSHMVRDILDLDVCLIYYPGHLSACVALTDDNVAGDYIVHDGKRYLVCDPTYFYSNAGNTAPSCNNAQATLIPLRKLK